MRGTPWGINPPFGGLSPSAGHVTHVLLTRAPLGILKASSDDPPYNLHVLNTPPAFVLSQNQTLRKKTQCSRSAPKCGIRNSYIEIDPGEAAPGPKTRNPPPAARRWPGSSPVNPSKPRGARFNLLSSPPDSGQHRPSRAGTVKDPARGDEKADRTVRSANKGKTRSSDRLLVSRAAPGGAAGGKLHPFTPRSIPFEGFFREDRRPSKAAGVTPCEQRSNIGC